MTRATALADVAVVVSGGAVWLREWPITAVALALCLWAYAESRQEQRTARKALASEATKRKMLGLSVALDTMQVEAAADRKWFHERVTQYENAQGIKSGPRPPHWTRS